MDNEPDTRYFLASLKFGSPLHSVAITGYVEFVLHPGAQKVRVNIGNNSKCYITTAHKQANGNFAIPKDWISRECNDRTEVTFSDKHLQASMIVPSQVWDAAGRYSIQP